MTLGLRRHPFAVDAWFDQCLALTYAAPADGLQALLPRGLEVDRRGDDGFLAVALVQARDLRPAGFPKALGVRLFLAGYRIFARWRAPDGRNLRGLYVLRSDTDRRSVALLGNLATGYRYQRCKAQVTATRGRLVVTVRTRDGTADLDVAARLDDPALPDGSPFPDWRAARPYAGPLPFTFVPDADGIVLVEGVHGAWEPRPVRIESSQVAFFARPPFAALRPRLASAFHLSGVPYHWRRGVHHRRGGAQ